MDTARRQEDGEEFHADEIWHLPGFKNINWCCIGCDYKATPVACAPGKHLVRAHFRISEHESDCQAEGFERTFFKAGTQKIQSKQGLSALVPSRVSFSEAKNVVSRADHKPDAKEQKKRYQHDETDVPSPSRFLEHRRWAKTLYRVALVHARTTSEVRKQLPLQVEGCDGTNYSNVFHALKNVEPEAQASLQERKIIYGSLLFNQKFSYEDSVKLTIKLNVGRKGPSFTKQKAPPYSVLVDWESWPAQQRSLFQNRLEATRKKLEED